MAADDENVFNASYVECCIKQGGVLDLEDFRLGGPSTSTINPTDILKGLKSWDDVSNYIRNIAKITLIFRRLKIPLDAF